MRDLLKTVLGKEITLSDGAVYRYIITQKEVVNALGTVVAVLDEYLITAADGTAYHLFKTKEGNWYNPDEKNHLSEQPVVQQLKRAIDALAQEVSE